ncbi:MAG: hypothetical protein NXI27_19030 [Alphaproteobacteria bacterium]|nr:hypothetical protein [Alphaproteobacteria bacterium]
MSYRPRRHCKWLPVTIRLAVLMFIAAPTFVVAQDKSSLLPIAVYQAMLDANRQSGWIQFRKYGGHQWIYFTALQTMHCRLSEIRYSINSQALDAQFPLVPCNLQNPFALPPDAGVEEIALRLPAQSAQFVAVQVVWDDGRESEIAVYEPCRDVGEQSCAWPIESN